MVVALSTLLQNSSSLSMKGRTGRVSLGFNCLLTDTKYSNPVRLFPFHRSGVAFLATKAHLFVTSLQRTWCSAFPSDVKITMHNDVELATAKSQRFVGTREFEPQRLK